MVMERTDYLAGGRVTVSMTWITPFEHSTSAVVTLAVLLRVSVPSTTLAEFLPERVELGLRGCQLQGERIQVADGSATLEPFAPHDAVGCGSHGSWQFRG